MYRNTKDAEPARSEATSCRAIIASRFTLGLRRFDIVAISCELKIQHITAHVPSCAVGAGSVFVAKLGVHFRVTEGQEAQEG